MGSRALAVALALAITPSALAMESTVRDLTRGGLATITPATSQLIVELKVQQTTTPPPMITASAATSQGTTVALGVTELSTTTIGEGAVRYLALDASPLCQSPGSLWIVTMEVRVLLELGFGVEKEFETTLVSRAVVCEEEGS